eukprot:12492125-Alexandrium_andersonii.AAC.1
MPLVRRVEGELLQGRDAARVVLERTAAVVDEAIARRVQVHHLAQRLGLDLVVLGLHLLDNREDTA